MRKIILIIIVVISFVSCKEEAKPRTDSVTDVHADTLESSKNFQKRDTSALRIEKIVNKKVTFKKLKEELTAKGYQTFDYISQETQDTILMQQYFIAFLKRGLVRNQNEEEVNRLQNEHLAHLEKMYELGYADISGPFGDDGDIRGITVYNVPTQELADSLANSDPMVKAGRLKIEIHPWWAAKGYSLR